jgi:hypothetical protein
MSSTSFVIAVEVPERRCPLFVACEVAIGESSSGNSTHRGCTQRQGHCKHREMPSTLPLSPSGFPWEPQWHSKPQRRKGKSEQEPGKKDAGKHISVMYTVFDILSVSDIPVSSAIA